MIYLYWFSVNWNSTSSEQVTTPHRLRSLPSEAR